MLGPFCLLAISDSLLCSPATAVCLLQDFVDLQPGDVVLQNGANSSVGKVSLQPCLRCHEL